MGNHRPRVSVVIPTYNHAGELKEALQSVVSQSMPHWEIWVINNYSRDNTVEVIGQFNDPRIHRVDIHNDGVIALSRNEGIKRSRGQLIAFLDSDDVWMPNKLERVIQCFNRDKTIGLVCHWEYVRKDEAIVRTLRYGPDRMATYRNLLFRGNQLSTSAVIVRKDLLDKVSGFDENPALVTVEDYDLWLKLARLGCKLVFLPEVLGEFRITGKNLSSNVELHYTAIRRLVMHHYQLLEGKNLIDAILLSRSIAGSYYGAAWEYRRIGSKRLAFKSILRSLVRWPLSLRSIVAIFRFLLE